MPEAPARLARLAAGLLILVAVFAAAFGVSRTGRMRQVRPNPIRLVGAVPVGVEHSAAGALAAADNYVAAGITDSVDQRALQSYANAVIAPSERMALLRASEQLAQRDRPPAGTSAIATILAHRLWSYTGATARVATWDLGSYWGPALPPAQYWALADVALRWASGRWQIVSVDERLPGPVPGPVGAGANTSAQWSSALAGMSAPYYGTG
jgi:hypothetical protein